MLYFLDRLVFPDTAGLLKDKSLPYFYSCFHYISTLVQTTTGLLEVLTVSLIKGSNCIINFPRFLIEGNLRIK